MTTKHYVTFYYRGTFVDEETTREIPGRMAIPDLPAGAFGYQVWDREEVEQDGEVLRGEPKRHGPMTYVGEVLTADDVRRTVPDNRILLSNMQGNGWTRVVRTRRGNFKPLLPGDVVLSEHGERVA